MDLFSCRRLPDCCSKRSCWSPRRRC